MEIAVRFFASAAAAANADEQTFTVSDGATVADLSAAITNYQPGNLQLRKILGISSFLVNGKAAGPDEVLPEGAAVDVLPPFAGGDPDSLIYFG